jgi:hypothetical protein
MITAKPVFSGNFFAEVSLGGRLDMSLAEAVWMSSRRKSVFLLEFQNEQRFLEDLMLTWLKVLFALVRRNTLRVACCKAVQVAAAEVEMPWPHRKSLSYSSQSVSEARG